MYIRYAEPSPPFMLVPRSQLRHVTFCLLVPWTRYQAQWKAVSGSAEKASSSRGVSDAFRRRGKSGGSGGELHGVFHGDGGGMTLTCVLVGGATTARFNTRLNDTAVSSSAPPTNSEHDERPRGLGAARARRRITRDRQFQFRPSITVRVIRQMRKNVNALYQTVDRTSRGADAQALIAGMLARMNHVWAVLRFPRRGAVQEHGALF